MKKNNLIYRLAKEHVSRASSLISLLRSDESGLGIALSEPVGREHVVNEAMEELFGKSADEIRGLIDGDLLSAAVTGEREHNDRQTLDQMAAAREELEMYVNGVTVPGLWLKRPVLAPDGTTRAMRPAILDTSHRHEVTELRQSMEQLRLANQELQQAMAELEQLASTDKLTGAWNRRRIEEAVVNEMERLKRYDHPLSLLVIDIDLFKMVNDQFGHSVGDQVLVQLAVIIRRTLRATDSLTRWGGEEFVVLSPNTTLSTAALLAERLREKIATADFSTIKHISVSIGVAECMSGETWEDWFKRADAALYRAKSGGRNQVQCAPEASPRLGVGESVSAHFVQLAWHPAYACGNTLVDDQHRALFGDANRLLAAILSARPMDEIAVLIDVLIGDVVQHFTDEEEIIREAGFPGATEHAAIHRKLVDSAVTLVGRFHNGTLSPGELFQFLAHDVIARHMLGADRQFFPFLVT